MSTYKNKSAGIGDPYWYEWSVGLLYALEMLNPDNNIKHVILQANDLQGLDDVVIVYNNQEAECIQIKHTRENDTLTFSDMIYKTSKKPSLLNSFCMDWQKAQTNNYKSCKSILFSNRDIGTRKSTVKDESGIDHVRPALELFWHWLKGQIEVVNELSNIVVATEWTEAWNLWLDEMNCLATDKLKLEFLKKFDIKANQADLDEIIDAIGNKLSTIFKVDSRVATQLDQKLCFALRRWTTTLRKKQEITKEDLFEALSLCSDEIQGEHNLKVFEPFFNSRVEFAKDLEKKLISREAPVIFLSGDPGSGKTNIVSHIANKIDSVVTLRFHAFKPLTAGDLYLYADKGISDSRALWGNFLIKLRELFTGKLSKHNVPISNELLTNVESLRGEVLRLSKILAEETGLTTIIVIDGIDHAARAGGNTTFLNTLVPPEGIPDGVCFLISGQPIFQYDSYPDWLADTDKVLHINVPLINEDDIRQLYCNSTIMLPSEHTDIAIKIINKIVAGNTLSAVFAIHEISNCSSIDDLEAILNTKKLSSGINAYYEYIWKSAKENIPSQLFYVDTILAGVLSIVNRRITTKIMTEICTDENISEFAWKSVMQKLYPIVIKEDGQFRVFHNDVRVYLEKYLRKDADNFSEVSSKIANYFLSKSDDIKTKHELIFEILKYAKRENEYIDIFTQTYVVEAIKHRRPMSEINEQLELTLNSITNFADFKKIIILSCAVATLFQYKQSLQWMDKTHNADFELPSALISEKKVVYISLVTPEILLQMLGDVQLLIEYNEIERANAILIRGFSDFSPEAVMELLCANMNVKFGENDEIDNDIKMVLETWGRVSRHSKVIFSPLDETKKPSKEVKYARSLFTKGWLEEGHNFLDQEGINKTIENIQYFNIKDFEYYVNVLVDNNKANEILKILSKNISARFSNVIKLKIVVWSIINQKQHCCTEWIEDIKKKRFDYVKKPGYDTVKKTFPLYSQIAFVLRFCNYNEVILIKECLNAFKGEDFTPKERGYYSAKNLLVSSAFLGFIYKCIADGATQCIRPEQFEACIVQLFDKKDPMGNYEVSGFEIEQLLLKQLIDVSYKLDATFQALLLKNLISRANDYENIRHINIYWEYLKRNKQEKVLLSLFLQWMSEDGLLWQKELSEINEIAQDFISRALNMGWIEEREKAQKLLDNKSVGYVGRKDYSLFSPLKWYKQLSIDNETHWETLGLEMLNVSKHASNTGDNRAAIYIDAAVAVSAGKQGARFLWEFANTKKDWDTSWLQTIFDGVIAALELGSFTENELLSIWAISTEIFFVNENASEYDTSNKLRKIYIADIKEAILLASKRLNFVDVEKNIKEMSETEFSQNRNSETYQSFKIPNRWYDTENEMSEAILSFLKETETLDCEKTWEELKHKFYNDKHNFRWDFIISFIDKIKKDVSVNIEVFIQPIVDLLMQRHDSYYWEWDGADRLFNAIFKYLNQNQIKVIMQDIVNKYLEENIYSDDSKLFGLNSDLDNFSYCYYVRLSETEKVEGLQELLNMHVSWVTGSRSVSLPVYYEKSIEVNPPFSWEDFCRELGVKLIH